MSGTIDMELDRHDLHELASALGGMDSDSPGARLRRRVLLKKYELLRVTYNSGKGRRIGSSQASVLERMQEHPRSRFPGGGWMWDNYSGTARLLNGLVRRGLIFRWKVKRPGHHGPSYVWTGRPVPPTVGNYGWSSEATVRLSWPDGDWS